MLKDEVLKILYLEDGYISGETISRKLGVTRAAVNSAVKALRDEGYEITSSTNRRTASGIFFRTLVTSFALVPFTMATRHPFRP